jgi:hypothetical protein
MIAPKVTGSIITGLIIIIGVALIYPALRIENKFGEKDQVLNDITNNKDIGQEQLILLTFNIINSSNMPSWCQDLSGFLNKRNIHSTIFMSGIIAETYPACVSAFNSNMDVGSMSYLYEKIPQIKTYPNQLSQITKGKLVIDELGKFNSTLFRAPYGSVDGNIYSLLSRSHIIVDFSYVDHYNIYTEGLSGKTFYRFPIRTVSNLLDTKNLSGPQIPVMLNFYNYDSIKSIEYIINSTAGIPHQFLSASELTNLKLTKR